nr:hypothetical protein [Cereibacter sphaeroides]
MQDGYARHAQWISCGRYRSGTAIFAPSLLATIGSGTSEDRETVRWTASPTKAVLFQLRAAFRSGDIWLARPHRYAI